MGEAKKVNIIHYIIVAALCLGFRFVPPVHCLIDLSLL